MSTPDLEKWTEETVRMYGDTSWNKRTCQDVADAHNAALQRAVAEKDRLLDLAGAQNWGIDNLKKLDELTAQLTAAKELIKTLQTRNNELCELLVPEKSV